MMHSPEVAFGMKQWRQRHAPPSHRTRSRGTGKEEQFESLVHVIGSRNLQEKGVCQKRKLIIR